MKLSNWLYENNACHPKAFDGEPDYFDKQAQFFDQDIRYKQGIEFYKKRFEHCLSKGNAASRIIFDATPNYLEFPKRVFNIYNQPSAQDAKSRLKLIFVLREPVEREFIAYTMKVNDYKQSQDKNNRWFVDVLENDGSLMSFNRYSLAVLRMYITDQAAYYRSGLYAMHLKQWVKYFDRKQILIINYNELVIDSLKVQSRIQEFLGLNFENKITVYDAINAGDIPSRAVEVLEPLFRKSNSELYDFLRNNTGSKIEEALFPPFPQRTTPRKHIGMVLPNILLIGAQKAGTSAASSNNFDHKFYVFANERRLIDSMLLSYSLLNGCSRMECAIPKGLKVNHIFLTKRYLQHYGR